MRRAWEAVGGWVEPDPVAELDPLGWLMILMDWFLNVARVGVVDRENEVMLGAGLEGGAVPKREWEGTPEGVVMDQYVVVIC